MRLVQPLPMVILAAAILGGCSAARPQPTELQLLQLQSRTYDTADEKLVMRAVLNVLGDRGYIVKTSNVEVGQITATKQEEAMPSWTRKLAGVALTRVMQCSVFVSRDGSQTRVRAVFEGQLIDEAGNVTGTEHADDPVKHGELYQRFFTDVEKAIFIQQQNL